MYKVIVIQSTELDDNKVITDYSDDELQEMANSLEVIELTLPEFEKKFNGEEINTATDYIRFIKGD